MPDYSVRPLNLIGDYLQGKQYAQQEQLGRQRNELAQLDIEQQRNFNALSQNPNASPEQFARIGRSDVANAITNQRQFEVTSKQQAIAQMGSIAQKALTLDPRSRKAFLQQAVQHYAPTFKALGADPTQGLQELTRIPDEALEQQLKQVAAFAQSDPQQAQFAQQERMAGVQHKHRLAEISAQGANRAPVSTYRALSGDELKRYGLPPGTSAQVDENTGKIDVISKRDNTGVLTQKDATTAKMKLNTVQLARQQLTKIKEAFAEGTKGINAFGPGQGLLPTQAGHKFDARVNQMRSTLTALTRVPGVGAMSDYETKLDQSKFPTRNAYESVTADVLQNLEDQLSLIETGYKDLLSGNAPDSSAPPSTNTSVSNVPSATGPNGEKIYFRNGQWGP
jgi:hypothetical protein